MSNLLGSFFIFEASFLKPKGNAEVGKSRTNEEKDEDSQYWYRVNCERRLSPEQGSNLILKSILKENRH